MRLERKGPSPVLMASTSEEQPLQEEKARPSCFVTQIKLIARLFGIITVVIMWVSTVYSLSDDDSSFIGWYLIPASTLVTFLEITWILNKSACCTREGCCCRIWSAIMWIDNWRKFLVYIIISFPLFLEGLDMALGMVSGFLLILLAMLYLVKTFLGSMKYNPAPPTPRPTLPKTPPLSVTVVEMSTQTDFLDNVPATLNVQSEADNQ